MMMTESMAVMRNAMLTKDTVGILSRGRLLADDAARIVLPLNRRYVTTTSWLWKIVFDLRTKVKIFNGLLWSRQGSSRTIGEEFVVSFVDLAKEVTMLAIRTGGKIYWDVW